MSEIEKQPEFYALVKILKGKDYCWFTVESNHEALFLYRFFLNLMKAFQKGFREGCKITVIGRIPYTMFKKDFIENINYEFDDFTSFKTLASSQALEARI